MAKAGYTVSTEASVALVTATAKTVLGVLAPATFGVDLRGIEIAFDGVTTTDKAVLCEVCKCTFATNPPGTNSTANTVQQVYGISIVAGFTGGYNWTTEPTVLAVVKTLFVSPTSATYDYDFPAGETLDNVVSTGYALRLTAPTNAVNARATFRFERT